MNRRELFTSATRRNVPRPPVPGFNKYELFTNATLVNQDGKKVKFYDDLCKNKQVILSTMYANCAAGCPIVTSNLLKVYKALKDRMGKNLFMYSLTVKPEEDTPEKMKEYAEMHGALLPGWQFLTGSPYDLETIRFRIFNWRHIMFDLDLDMHTSMIRIINDTTNQWIQLDPHASTYTVLEHIHEVDPPISYEERLERNKALQAKIDKERKEFGFRMSNY